MAWAEAHIVSTEPRAATWGDTPLPLAGEGAPMISEFCVPELAAALGMSTDSGRAFLAHALEISYRLPRVWARVQAGDLPVWRARRIAEHTLTLSLDAAAHVDAQVAPFAHKIGIAATERLVEEAIARHMPVLAEERAEAANKSRFVSIDHDGQAYAGTSSVYGSLDTADALDLEHALRAGAETLKAAGSEETLDVRRAAALGALARGEQALELTKARDLTLYVHLNGDLATLENAGGHLLTTEQVRAWCGNPDAKITVKPVIDPTASLGAPGYAIPDKIREHVVLRDQTCIFPFCTRPARRCDLDHITPHADGGDTSTANLAPLCRRHHRLKTHGGWIYLADPAPDTATGPDGRSYRWLSPQGYEYLRTRHGTESLTPRPVAPPGASPGA